jgi:hypothetical protein
MKLIFLSLKPLLNSCEVVPLLHFNSVGIDILLLGVRVEDCSSLKRYPTSTGALLRQLTQLDIFYFNMSNVYTLL